MSTIINLNVDPDSELVTLNATEDNTLVTINVTIGDGSGGSGGVETSTELVIVGENTVEGNIVYLKDDGKYWKADNLTESRIKTEIRWVNETIAADDTGSVTKRGLVTTTGLVAGEVYYVGTNGGILAHSSIPDTEGLFLKYIGTAKSTTELEFNPDQGYVELTLVADNSQALKRSVHYNQTGAVSAGDEQYTDYIYFFTGSGTLVLPTAVGNTNRYLVIIDTTSTVNISSTGGQLFNNTAGPIVITRRYIQIELFSNNLNWFY